MAIYQLGDDIPVVPASCFVAPEATIIGKVILGERVTIWPGVVIRGDTEAITVGDDSNVQDGTVMHADFGFPCVVGKRVTIGHQAMLHGCVLEDECLIGIQAVVLNGARVGSRSLIAAGAIVMEGATIAENSLALGTPAKVVRTLSPEQTARIAHGAEHYVERGAFYQRALKRVG